MPPAWRSWVFAMIVITGWIVALIWLTLSVTQIGIQQVFTPDLCAPSPGVSSCSP